MGKLDGKVALITGGGSGIGKAIALKFAEAGANAAVAGRKLQRLENVAEEIRKTGPRALAVAIDVGVSSQVNAMVEKVIREFGKIDILVNGAGFSRRAPLLEMKEEDWDAVIDTNLKGTFLCSQAVARHMVKQHYGKIINISAFAGVGEAAPFAAPFAASKSGVVALTKCFAKELGPHNINVNAVAPGLVFTEFMTIGRTQEFLKGVEEYYIKHSVMGRVGTVEDMATLVFFLATDESSFIAGEVIEITGGKFDRM